MALSIYFFYNIYFVKKIDRETKSYSENDLDFKNNTNNQIKNLQYNLNLNENNQYKITSKFSELAQINGIEIVKMQKVEAKLTDKKKLPFLIIADEAEFNSSNYNTVFKNNVLITYMNNKILSDKLYLDLENNMINIFHNVKYIGEYGTINTDNISINLFTKKIDIFMNENNRNVELIKN